MGVGLAYLNALLSEHFQPRVFTGHFFISLLSLWRFDLLLLPTTALLPLLDKSLLMFRLLLIVILSQHHLNITYLKAITIHSALHILLLLCSPHNPFFNSAFCYQPINSNVFGLADSVGSISCLFVHGWIPVIIIKNYSVSGDQIDA